MKPIYISTFCVDFRDYDMLYRMMEDIREVPLGIEFGTSWHHPDFRQRLDEQVERFRGYPVTLHAPFEDICCAPGSAEYARMEELFLRAIDWYHRFGATSMVMHTHDCSVPAEQKRNLQERSEAELFRMAELARREGIRLTVENVGFSRKGSMLYNQGEYIRLFDRLPGDVGALIDLGHAMVNGWDIEMLVKVLGPRIRGFHLHTNDGTSDGHRPLFTQGMCYTEGQMQSLLHTICTAAPNADLILEYAPGPHITPELLRTDALRLRELGL